MKIRNKLTMTSLTTVFLALLIAGGANYFNFQNDIRLLEGAMRAQGVSNSLSLSSMVRFGLVMNDAQSVRAELRAAAKA